MKKYVLLSVLLFTLVCFGLAGFFAQMTGKEGMSDYWTAVTQHLIKQVEQRKVAIALDAKQIVDLQIKIKSGDLTIETSPDEEVHILLNMDAKADVVKESEILTIISPGVFLLDLDKIKISEKDVQVQFQNEINLNVTVKNAEVVVQLPASIKKLNASTISGKLKISLASDEMTAASISGDIKISGNIARLTTNTISGDTKIKLEIPSAKVSMSSISGDLKVAVRTEPDFVLDFETTSGELNMDRGISDTHFDGSFKGYQLGKGTGKIGIKTVSGDARISRETATE